MMGTLLACILLVLALIVGATEVSAERYSVTISRRGSNFYEEHSSRAFIETRFCYEYVYYESVILEYERGSPSNRLVFGRDRSCPVVGIYRPNANLTRIADDLYQDTNTGGYLRTFACYEYVYWQDAIVFEDRVLFTTGDRCDRAIY